MSFQIAVNRSQNALGSVNEFLINILHTWPASLVCTGGGDVMCCWLSGRFHQNSIKRVHVNLVIVIVNWIKFAEVSRKWIRNYVDSSRTQKKLTIGTPRITNFTWAHSSRSSSDLASSSPFACKLMAQFDSNYRHYTSCFLFPKS